VHTAAAEVLGRTIRPRYAMPLFWGSAVGAAVAVAVVGWTVLAPAGSARVPPKLATALPSASAVSTASPAEARVSASNVSPSLPMTSATSPRLAGVLAEASLRSDKQSAFTALYALWGVAYDRRSGAACAAARSRGLECLSRMGTWTKLRRLGVPAIIELAAPTGVKHYTVVTALGPQTATLEFGERKLTLALDDVDSFWDGAFTLLWRPPSPGVASIGPGGRAEDIEWLRGRLTALDGKPLPTKQADVYDEALRGRVMAFQRSRSLVPDGIAGEETLTHLSSTLRDSTVPVLASPRP
jgi:general secretion pathway protein A